jgi:thymidine phosphorylase
MSSRPVPNHDSDSHAPKLRARRLRLHTRDEPVVLLRADSPVSRSEGLDPRSRVVLSARGKEVRATLFEIEEPLIGPGDAALSEAAWQRLGLRPDEAVSISHAPPLASLACVRRRIHGNRLDEAAIGSIVTDVAAGNYADIHLAAFLTASSAMPLDDDETYYLTKAMVACGDRLHWSGQTIVDKHSLGGLPGNRTTPIIVAVAAACGLTMPKTSSRAITSPAGTADMMEVLAPVDLDLKAIRRVVAAEGACLAWGGAVSLSPADDIFIGVERMLDIDTEGQLIASILSKKIAAGATHVVIDIPVGPTAKIRSAAVGEAIARRLETMAGRFGVKLVCVATDGSQPIGRGIGPALEAIDVLAVLRNEEQAPQDLRERACLLAGTVLELGRAAPPGQGARVAEETIASGRAFDKFERICRAQGGFGEPQPAPLARSVDARHSGRIVHLDNRKLAQLAKLAGAPNVKGAGLRMEVRLGQKVTVNQPLATIHAEVPGNLDYAFAYALANPEMIEIA